MPTPLEAELQSQYPHGGIPLSQTTAIIGTDDNQKRGGQCLKTLYLALQRGNPSIDSNCLSAVLVNEDPANPHWTQAKNDQWIAGCIANPQLNTFYIAHKECNQALATAAAANNGVITEAAFVNAYKGVKGATYGEVIRLIKANYVDFEATNIGIGWGFGKAGKLSQ